MSSMLRAPRKLRAAISVVASLMLVLAMAGGVAAATGRNISVDHGTAATDAVPLTVTLYKQICPDYAHVPANAHGSPNDIGEANSVQENSTKYTARPIDPSNSTAVGCVAAPRWTFQFKNSQNGGVISSHVTGADGSVTVALNTDELALARSSTGLWVLEVTNPSAPFGEIRCYNDAINDDNLEQITSVPDSVSKAYCFAYNVALLPALSITKTLDSLSATFSAVNDKLTYKYTLKNEGNVDLTGPFTVTDTQIGSPKNAAFTCDAGNLAVGASTSCTATYTVVQADINTGSVYNEATGHVAYGGKPVDSNTAHLTVNATQGAALSIAKTASPKTYSAVGDVIKYDITLTNKGNVTLSGPFTVDDPLVSDLACGKLPASLAPGGEIKCTASYAIKQSDLNSGSVTNTATGHATFREAPVDSKPASAIATAAQGPALSIVKTASAATYAAVGEILHFTITLTNAGNVTLANPLVSDPTVGDLYCGEGQGMPTFLLPAQKVTCTASHTIIQDDINAGSVSNTATGHAILGDVAIDTDPSTVIVNAVQGPRLDLKKEAKQTTFAQAGDKLDYTYTLTNNGNVSLSGPFTVTDDKITDPNAVTCPATPTSLAHGETIVCTATYTVTGADISAGSVANKAIAHAAFGEQQINSEQKTVTISITPPESAAPTAAPTATPVEQVAAATATSVRATPPPTSSNGNSSDNGSLPLLLLLIAFAFGGLGLLAVQAQRSTIRR